MNKTAEIVIGTIFIVIVIVVVAVVITVLLKAKDVPKFDLKSFLKTRYEKIATKMCTKLQRAAWVHSTDTANRTKEEIYERVQAEHADFVYKYWRSYFKDVNPDSYKDEQVRRQVFLLKRIGVVALERKKLKQLNSIKADMMNVFASGRICPYNTSKCDLDRDGLSLAPEISDIFANSTDYDELLYLWNAWREIFNATLKEQYRKYVDLGNEAANANNLGDYSELYLSKYESPTFVKDVEDLWLKVEPLYRELHKYVGRKLKEHYGDKLDISDGLIPAHVLGNMWAEDWTNIGHLIKPFPQYEPADGSQALKDAQYTVLEMFSEANEFYKSLGLLPNDICYNTSAGAIIEEPSDGREIVCMASAWDFCDGKNYRIKMCGKISLQDFTLIHVKMGYIQYFLQYAKKLHTFRTAANPGFFSAVGNTIALSVMTPKHLQQIGIFKEYNNTEEASLNALMDKALRKIAGLPFALVLDKWRWDVFSGKISDTHWNARWWDYRKQYQKLKPPTERTEANLDPASKYHVSADFSYIQFFVSDILQFQLYRSLCIAAGQYNPWTKIVPLSNCDFHYSKKAGQLLSKGLELGASKHWSDVLEIMTGSRKMDASAVLEYFEPLHRFLIEENSKMT